MRGFWSRLRRRSLPAVLCALLGLASLGFGPPHLTDSAQPTTSLSRTDVVRLRDFPDPPPLTARNALIMDAESGHVVWGLKEHEHIAPASTTKIMTAVIAIERGRLTDQVTVTYDMIKSLEGTGSSLMPLLVGDTLTLEDLLYGLLLPSGNDAALVIAYLVAGSPEKFVALMNAKADELGLHDTHFSNPHGLDADDHYTSAHDLAMMGRYGLQNAVFARIVGTERTVREASRAFFLANTNRLLGMTNLYPGINGIKTGSTERAGDSIIASATRNGRTLVVAAMGTRGRNPDTVRLFDYGFDQFQWIPLLPPAFSAVGDEQQSAPLARPAARTVLASPWDFDRVVLRRILPSGDGMNLAAIQYLLSDGWTTIIQLGKVPSSN